MHSIGDAAKQSGCTVQTIRYYERVGLIASPVRTSGNQRIYDADAVSHLAFIRHARALGFGLDAIRDLLGLSATPDRDCAQIDAIARTHLDAVRERISHLRALETELTRMIEACKNQTVSECRIVQVLSDHGMCASEH
ncbi:MAG: helix-turn-helix domain-containing protein [Proteobacteria bacterium]|nr:helix-turn-helix domain-containing protein [Pseudomonadota bacterium]MDA1308698.1 helix-turn-helix domain-containing protein [Pseudomonadota bacterium]